MYPMTQCSACGVLSKSHFEGEHCDVCGGTMREIDPEQYSRERLAADLAHNGRNRFPSYSEAYEHYLALV